MGQRTFLMIDVADSSELVRNPHFGSDAETRNRNYQSQVNCPFKNRIKAVAATHQGEIFNDMGDALFLAFESPIAATRCAVETLNSFRDHPLLTIPEQFLHCHAGLHTGYADRDSIGNWQGDGVNATARVEAFSGKDQILMSEQTRDLCEIADIRFHRLGDFLAKGIGHLVLWEADWDGNGPRRTKKPPIRPDLDQPPLLNDFVGREVELGALANLLDEHRAICLEGMSGIGKTSTLVQLALRRLREDRLADNAFFYFDCAARDMRSEDAGDHLLAMLGDYLGQLGTADSPCALVRNPEVPVLQRINALVAALHDAPCLILIDNLQEALDPGDRRLASERLTSHLREILQRNLDPSRVIFASYEHWTPPDRVQLHTEELQPLELGEAKELLKRTGLTDAEVAETAYRIVGGHPQALRWFSVLATDQRIELGDVIKSLEDLQRDCYTQTEFRHRIARELLDRVHVRLPNAAQLFLAAGAIFRIPPPFRAIHAVTSLDETTARTARVQVLNHFLAESTGLEAPHVFHPLVREYCMYRNPFGSEQSRRLHAAAAAWWSRQHPMDELDVRIGMEQHFHLVGANELEAAAQLEAALLPRVHDAGRAARQAGNLKDSLKNFLWAVKHEPQSGEAHRKLAQVYSRLGDPKAEEEFQCAEKLDPDSAKLHVEYGRWLYKHGKVQRGLEHLSRARSLEPDNAITRSEYRLILAKNAQSRGMSLPELLANLETDPSNEPLRMQVARQYRQHDDPEMAESLLRNGLGGNPKSAHLRTELALLQIDLCNLKLAEEELRVGIRHNPSDGPLRNVLGKLLAESDRFPEAEAEFRAGIDANARMPHLRNEYAQLLERLQRFDEAAQQFAAGIAAEPTNGPLRNEYVGFLLRRGQTQKAEKECLAGLAAVPEHSPLRHRYAVFLAEQGRDQDAEHQFCQGIQLDSSNAALRYDYARFLNHAKRFGDALTHTEAGLKAAPDFGPMRMIAVEALQALDRNEEMEKVLQEGLERDPENPFFRNALGKLLAQMGHDSEAEKEFRKGLDYHPGQTGLCNEFARFLLQRKRLKEACKYVCAGLRTEPRNTYLLRTRANLQRTGFRCVCN